MNAPGDATVSESVDWKLAEALYGQRVILLFGGLVPSTVGVMGFFRTGQPWFLVWSSFVVVLLVLRVLLAEAFARRRGNAGRPARWKHLALVGACLNGALCGIGASLAILLGADPYTQMFMNTTLVAFVMGSAARSAAFPPASIGSAVFAIAPLTLTLAGTREIYSLLYGAYSVFFLFSALTLTRHLYAQTLSFLIAAEEKAELMAKIQQANRELESANSQLAGLAATDGLTGVANRRKFDEVLLKELRRARRDDSAVALILLDIDSFKQYNDRYGHQAGDECLRRVARAIDLCLQRGGDLLARYGGEEFAVILPGIDGAGATEVAQAIRATVQSLGLENADTEWGCITVSMGVAWAHAATHLRESDLIGLADEALYAAKHAGRNRVHVAPPESVREGLREENLLAGPTLP